MVLSIIIVNYNVKEFLQNLIQSIKKSAKDLVYEIIVVDNASDDGSVEFLSEKFPGIILIANKKNLGFSKANNLGLEKAKGKYILLLNPDTLVQEDTFQSMINFFEQTPDAGLAGCKILNPDGTLQLACRRSFPGPWTSFCKVTGLSSLFPYSKLFARYNLTYLDENKTYEVDAVSGSFMMFRKELYEKIGGLDEQFFMYGEDLDLCYRIQKAGYKVYYVHSTQIIHYKGESTKRSSVDETKIFYEAMHLFVKKHLASSFLVELILRAAIVFRKFFAFLGSRKLIISSIFLDFVFFNITLFLAEKIYSLSGHWRGFPDFSLPIIYTVPALIHITAAALIKLYKRDSLSVLRNFSAIFISFFLISSLTFFFKQYAYSRAVIIITYLLLLLTLTLWRIILKLFFRVGVQTGNLHKRTLIIGVNSPAVQIAERLNKRNTEIHSVVGLVGFTNKDIGKQVSGFPVLGTIENLSKVILQNKITEVIFPSEELSYNKMMSIVSSSRIDNVDFMLIGSNLDFLVGKTSVTILDDMPLIEIKYNTSLPLLRFYKRLFDLSLAFPLLIFIYPFIYFLSKTSKVKTDFQKFILSVPSVLSGKLSFVGPKEASGTDLFLGKKGLTGFWYIDDNDLNSERMNIFYAKNQNVWLDLEILGKTFNKMWTNRL